jgi:hypothetical protein
MPISEPKQSIAAAIYNENPMPKKHFEWIFALTSNARRYFINFLRMYFLEKNCICVKLSA